MNKQASLDRRPRLMGFAIIMCLGAAIAINGCGPDTAGFACSSEEECADDLSCEVNQQGSVCSEGFCSCDYQQSTCTQSCASDDDCPYDLICNRSSTCGGAPDLCGRP